MLNIKNIAIFLQNHLRNTIVTSQRVVFVFSKEIESKTSKKIVLSTDVLIMQARKEINN